MNICLEAHKVLRTRESALGIMQYNGKEKGVRQWFYWPCLGRQGYCVQIDYRV
jgi:hypothetical protein